MGPIIYLGLIVAAAVFLVRCDQPRLEDSKMSADQTEWEEVNGSTARLRVPGGWIYRVLAPGNVGSWSGESGARIACVFVPDPPVPSDTRILHDGTTVVRVPAPTR
jgi:hypothetical protein